MPARQSKWVFQRRSHGTQVGKGCSRNPPKWYPEPKSGIYPTASQNSGPQSYHWKKENSVNKLNKVQSHVSSRQASKWEHRAVGHLACDLQTLRKRVVAATLHCQPDWLWNHRKSTLLGLSIGYFQGGLTEEGGATLSVNNSIPWADWRVRKRGGSELGPALISLCFSSADIMCWAVSHSYHHAFWTASWSQRTSHLSSFKSSVWPQHWEE